MEEESGDMIGDLRDLDAIAEMDNMLAKTKEEKDMFVDLNLLGQDLLEITGEEKDEENEILREENERLREENERLRMQLSSERKNSAVFDEPQGPNRGDTDTDYEDLVKKVILPHDGGGKKKSKGRKSKRKKKKYTKRKKKKSR